jgi:hypothetical protein
MKFDFLAKDARELSYKALSTKNTKNDKWAKYALKSIKKDIKTASKAGRFSVFVGLSYPNDCKLRNFLGRNVQFKRPEVCHKIIQLRLEESFKEAGYRYTVWFYDDKDRFYISLYWNNEEKENGT